MTAITSMGIAEARFAQLSLGLFAQEGLLQRKTLEWRPEETERILEATNETMITPMMEMGEAASEKLKLAKHDLEEQVQLLTPVLTKL
jgi:hypothetical protein